MEALALTNEMGNWGIVRRDNKFAQKITTGKNAISLCVFHVGHSDEQQERQALDCGPIDSWNELQRKLKLHKGIDWEIADKEAVIFSATEWGNLRVSCEPVAKPSELEVIFNGLVTHWQEETGLYSVTTRRYAHPSYHAILVLKDDVVPLILRELQTRPDWWFEALKTLTKQDPVSPNSTFEQAVRAWIEWGKRTKIIA
jgi:hypothetical protein